MIAQLKDIPVIHFLNAVAFWNLDLVLLTTSLGVVHTQLCSIMRKQNFKNVGLIQYIQPEVLSQTMCPSIESHGHSWGKPILLYFDTVQSNEIQTFSLGLLNDRHKEVCMVTQSFIQNWIALFLLSSTTSDTFSTTLHHLPFSFFLWFFHVFSKLNLLIPNFHN